MSEKLVSPQRTIEIIKKYEFTFRKKFGQNFLIDERVIERIIQAADISKEDCVLEIGPGIGALTQYLALSAGRVVAVEIDQKLIPILEDTLSGFDNVTVINRDILKTDLQEISDTWHEGKPLKVVANLPYYITTPIIMGLLEKKAPISSVTVMVQKEVADRMKAGPGSKEYGALSLAVQYYSDPQTVTIVPPNCFIPRPSVESAVVALRDVGVGKVPVQNEKLMFALIRASFNQRRKTLANGIKNAAGLTFSREQVVAALEQMGLDANARGETLSLAQFAQLADLLEEK
ncbi:MAG: 16S rRNA (adenine(1518)-N(6)/adenine(1519)-N(6))-dimethyltransferase RsmA [Lachnospiraceae bacterium]|nr:16S rRNA (adenine(1518)-N(6)/adenine(1519)-N(6))-dimethyltransferase RsmA [Lachnospiraceae bacterium]